MTAALRHATVGTVLLLVVTGCASTSPKTSYPPATAAQLQQDTLAVTRAASTKDYAAAELSLARLRQDLNAAKSADQIGQSRATEIAASADRVAAYLTALSAMSKATPSPSTPTVRAQAPAPKPTKDHRHRHHDGGQGDSGGQGDNGD